jgi:hypothetical protein
MEVGGLIGRGALKAAGDIIGRGALMGRGAPIGRGALTGRGPLKGARATQTVVVLKKTPESQRLRHCGLRPGAQSELAEYHRSR